MSTAVRIADPPRPALVVGFALVAAAAAVTLPLATYSTTLALFGGAHVLAELRYVDVAFRARIGAWLLSWLAVTLSAIVALRIAAVTGLVDATSTVPVELWLVVGGAVGALPMLLRLGGWRLPLGVALVAALAAGVFVAPVVTLAVLAVAHNLTPLGFLADALPTEERRRFLPWALVAFVGIPAIILTGLPHAVLDALGLVRPDAALLDVGPLSKHLHAFAPTALPGDVRQHLFSAAVTGQCLHYAAVIGVMPGLLPPGEARGLVRWPAHATMLGLLLGGSLALFVLFAADFGGARSWYGVAAAVHAWVELPVLLVALAGRPR